MKKTLSLLAAALGFLVLFAIFQHFRSLHQITESTAEPRLLALKEPFQKIKTAFYMDGGSIGIEIIDKNGTKELFALPVDSKSKVQYQHVYIGSLNVRIGTSILVADSRATKVYLINILRRYSRGDPYIDSSISSLTGSPLDLAIVILHKVTGAYDIQ